MKPLRTAEGGARLGNGGFEVGFRAWFDFKLGDFGDHIGLAFR
jgi:hypothetical protein